MKKISSYLLKNIHFYLFSVLCLLAQITFDMLSPQISKRVIDDVLGNGKWDLLPSLLVGLAIITLGRGICGYVKEYSFDSTSSRISKSIRKDLFSHVQKLSVGFFDKTNTGELMSRVKDDVDRVWDGLNYVSMLILEVVLRTGMILFFLYRLSPKLTLVPLIAIPIVALVAIFMEKKLDKVYEDISEENATLNTIAQENLSGVRTVKSFAREKFEINKFLSHNKKYYELNMTQSRIFIRYEPIIELITKLLPIVVIIIGGFEVVKDTISLGTLTAFAEYCYNIVWPIEMIGWLSNSMATAFASGKRIRKLADEKPIITDPATPTVLDHLEGNLTFDHVSLSLDKKDILKDISFELKSGKTLGIMGCTGSGKTTICNLLQRFYDPTEGSILLDGVNLKDLTLRQLRSATAPVMQDVFLFSDTIDNNVRLGMQNELSSEEINTSLEKAQAMEFVDKLKEKENTLIGERGVGLSGGQKQRISIARAFAKHAPILVMDDATSALDTETEQEIQKTLRELSGVSKIIITHRISAVRKADEIIVLENGSISERGTHESLLNQKGLYYETYQSQYGAVL